MTEPITDQPPDLERPGGRCAVLFLSTAVGLLLIAAAWVLTVGIAADAAVDHVDAVWIGLATDLAEGTFYRPLVDGDVTGGTRYMPLYFTLHAVLIRLGCPALTGGYVLTLLATVGLLSGVCALLRRLGVGWMLSALFSLSTLACFAVVDASMSLRGDMLAAALNVWGLAFCVADDARGRRARVATAATFFILAFAAKLTAVFGLAAGALSLWLSGRRRVACRLAATTVAGMLAVVAVVVVASEGRFLDNMLTCAAGGMTLAGLPDGAARFVTLILRDPVAAALVVFALAAAFSAVGVRKELPVVAFLLTLAAAFVILLSPGTDANHLIDLMAVAVVLLAVMGERGRLPRPFVMTLVALLALVSAGNLVNVAVETSNSALPAERAAVVDIIRRAERPVFCESALLPILAGRRPEMLNPFSFRLIAETDGDVAEHMRRRLAGRTFEAVILCDDGDAEHRRLNLGEFFMEWLTPHYAPAERYGRYVVYRPRRFSQVVPAGHVP